MERIGGRVNLIELTVKSEYRCVEVGVARGDYMENIIVYASDLIAIDLWRDDMVFLDNGVWVTWTGQQCYEAFKNKFSNLVDIRRGNSVQELNKLPDKSVDWVYIDANHTFEAVLADLEAALPKTRHWICGHDYCEIEGFGPIRAVERFCERHNLEITYLTSEQRMPVCGHDWTVAYDSYAIEIV
jgi:hypothetical protein